jgi:hypothetical protein
VRSCCLLFKIDQRSASKREFTDARQHGTSCELASCRAGFHSHKAIERFWATPRCRCASRGTAQTPEGPVDHQFEFIVVVAVIVLPTAAVTLPNRRTYTYCQSIHGPAIPWLRHPFPSLFSLMPWCFLASRPRQMPAITVIGHYPQQATSPSRHTDLTRVLLCREWQGCAAPCSAVQLATH